MKLRTLSLLLVILALLAAACGSVEDASADDPVAGDDATPAAEPSDDPADEGGGDPTQASTTEAADGAAEEAAPQSGPVTVTDARGEELQLDAPATEVVGLEWGVVENLVSLGVMPVGVADVEGYGSWVTAAPLEAGVTDVGMRGEPSIDALVALDPDLVIATTDLSPEIAAQIEEFVPVLVVRAAAAEQPIQQMRDNLALVAQAVGRTAEAEQLIADFDTHLEEAGQQLADAGLAGTEFTLADGYEAGGGITVRAFTAASLAGAVGEELGLVNAWDLEADPDYGLAVTDVEGLTALGDVQFIYYSNAVETDVYEGLEGNAIWEALPFVQAEDVHRLPDGIWMFGGTLSMAQYVDALVDVLTA